MKNQSKIRKINNLILQLIIFVVTYFFIYKQVFLKSDVPSLWVYLKVSLFKQGHQSVPIIIVILMLLNWLLEAVKWKYLIGRIESVSFPRAIQAVFTGISISTFTPNRVGEYIGRVFFLKKASHIEGILITIVGSMAQLLITIILGTTSLLIFIPDYLSEMFIDHGYLYYTLFILIVSLNIILLALYFNLSFLTTLKERILQNRLQPVRKFFRVFSFYHNRELAIVMALSLARYLVFSAQFFILIRFFNIQINYPDAMIIIALIYLIMTVMPTIALTELGIRGSVAIYFFSLWFSKTNPGTELFNAGVLAASLLLWMINLGIPAIIGTVFIFRLQFFRKTP